MTGLRMIGLALCLLCVCRSAGAGEGPVSGEQQTVLTGNIRVDLFGASSMTSDGQEEGPVDLVRPQKSPWLAAGMSLLVPGAGEFYAESYWKAAAFFAVGVTAWTVAYTQNQKGNDQTASFEKYANQNWDVAKYTKWTRENASNIAGRSFDTSPYRLFLDPGETMVDWSELNRLERDLGNWYSHTLPTSGEQQYYELIGKYQQYYQGWGDADPTLTTYDAIDARLRAGGTQFTFYSGERGKANDYYSTSSTAVTLAVLTHLLSSADAAWTASSYNKQFDAGLGFKKAMDGPVYVSYPALEVLIRF